MSENKDNETPGVTDSQETFYDKSQNMNASQSFNESQDFALVVADDSDEGNRIESEVDKEAVNHTDEKNVVEAERSESDEGTKRDNDNVVDKPMDKKDSEDEDIIQGTPPEVSSPSRKLLSGKRRGESLEEPAAKIQRTLSQSDALKLAKEKSLRDSKLFVSKKYDEERDTQSDIICDNTEAVDEEIFATQSSMQKKIVIEETQDLENSEAIPLENAATKSADDTSEKDKDSVDESYVTTSKPTSSDAENEAMVDKKAKSDPQSTSNTISKTADSKEAVTNGQGSDNIAKSTAMDVEEATESAESEKDKFFNVPLPSSDSTSDSNCEGGSMNSNKSRQSIEVIYDRKSSSQEKKRIVPLVEIGEEGDEIILEVSTESLTHSPHNTTVYKSCMDSKTTSDSSYKSAGWNNAACPQNDTIETSDCLITNGDEELPNSGTTKTISVGSDQLDSDAMPDTTKSATMHSVSNDSDVYDRFKLSDSLELANAVIDGNVDSPVVNENKSEDKADASMTKSTPFEKKTNFYMELKYLLHIDDNTKEIVGKELTHVQCEQLGETSNAQKSSDTSGCLADISGNANKELSPGSVVSNPQLFQLGPSRFSIASTISSSSSVSSAASLAVKLSKDVHFSLPKGRAKQARRSLCEAISEEKLNHSENFEKSNLGWKNAHLITESVLQFLNTVVNSPDIFHQDTEPEKRQDKVLSSTPEPDTTDNKVLSSTPEPRSGPQDDKVISQTATPKSTKNKKPLKRSRAKSNSTPRNNGTRKASPEIVSTSQEDRLPVIKKKRDSDETVKSAKQNIATPSRQRPETPRLEALRSLTPQNLEEDELVGKVVFARWSDKQYYPGKITEKSKGKYRVNFFDGKSKLLIEDFVIPMPDVLREGLSVYATSKDDDYGSMGIIVRSEQADDKVYYTIDVDQGSQIRVQIKDIFLMPDQAQILKEEVEMDSRSLPKTPQHLGQVSLDNLVDGKRRSRQTVTTPTVSTPKSRKRPLSKASKLTLTDSVSASGSGVTKPVGKAQEISSSESEALTSDSNVWSTEDVDGVQPELITVPVALSKGPRTKAKGQTRSKQTQDDEILGPIPPASSNIFKNMSFILTATSSDLISRHHTDDSGSELGTENEDEWLQIPFVKDRVKQQLINGGGTVYDSFKLIPQNEYKITKLITNAPNLTAKSVQCFSVGIPVYTHRWVIECCREVSLFRFVNGKKFHIVLSFFRTNVWRLLGTRYRSAGAWRKRHTSNGPIESTKNRSTVC